MWIRVAAAALLSAVPAAASAGEPVRVGAPVTVVADPASHEQYADVAGDPSGAFVVVWQKTDPRAIGTQGIFGRRFDPSGAPRGGAFRIDPPGAPASAHPAVAADAAGNFVTVWSGPGPADAGGIFARRYDATGAALGAAFLVNSYTTGAQERAAVAADAEGNFVVAWEGDHSAGAGIAARRFDASGVALGPEFVVTAHTTGAEWDAAVALDALGTAVITWRRIVWDPSGRYFVVGRRYDGAGAPLSPELPISSDAQPWLSPPAVAAEAGGRFLVAWTSGTTDAGGEPVWPVWARAYEADGAPAGEPFPVDALSTGYQGAPAVVSEAPARFLVSWTAEANDGHDSDLMVRRYEAAGAGLAPAVRINPDAVLDPALPRLASDGNGHTVVAMAASPEDRFDYDVVAQRIGPDLIFEDGFESGSAAAWDAAGGAAGQLSVCQPAALDGTTFGLQGMVTDPGGLYVQDDSPRAENHYRARFHLDPGHFDPGESEGRFRTRVFVAFAANPDRRLFAIVLKRQADEYSLIARARLASGAQAEIGPVAISRGPRVVEAEWVQGSGAHAGEGALNLWIDGALSGSLAGLSTPAAGVEFARLGALSAKPGAAGAIFWDEFESRRESYIGP